MAEEKRRNRRKGPDLLVKTINNIAAFSWLIIFAMFILFSVAKPSIQGIRPGHQTVTTGAWDSGFLQIAFYLMIFQVFLCAFGLVINTNRLKRKTDSYNKSLIIFGSLSLLGIALFAILS